MHMAPLAIQIVMVPAGVIVILGLRNPPRSWTSTMGPSLPGFTIAPCVDLGMEVRVWVLGNPTCVGSSAFLHP
jgi:hypothetical protein